MNLSEYGQAHPEQNPEEIPEMLSEQLLHVPGFVRLEIPKPWKIKHIPSPD